MKTITFKLSLLCFVYLLFNITVKAQILDSENKLSLTLKDGTQVTLFGKPISFSDRQSKSYYYLPTEPRLSKKKDGTPQFLFLKYMTDKEGDISGALLHMLMEWGLTPIQRKEVEGVLRLGKQGAKKGSKLLGAADVVPDGDHSFRVISAVLSDDTLAPSVITSSKAPTLPGSKIAVATNLNKNGAQLLAATFEKGRSITDLSIELGFKYTVQMPAAKGYARIHWSKMKTQFERDSAHYNKTREYKDRDGVFGPLKDEIYGREQDITKSYDEMHEVIETMFEKEYITLKWEESMSDDRISKMRDAFYDYFLNKMTNTANTDKVKEPTEMEKQAMPNIKYGKEYTFNRSFFKSNFQRGNKTLRFSAKLAVDKYFSVTGNLASWYDGVRDNPKCVSSVLLNDPFFERNLINFNLDYDAAETLGKGVNNVTVNVRKKRSNGNDFIDHLILDEKNGTFGNIEFAKGIGNNSNDYEYKVQWSIRGTGKYPENPTYQRGDLASVTLFSPVSPRTIEFEADLDELSEMGITRATLQLRYYKLGKEVQTNMPMTISKGEGLVEKTIYIDKDTQGYAYQLVLNNKDASIGKMALGWNAKANDNYVYASIPEELKNQDVEFIEKVIEAGEAIVKPKKNGEVSKAATVLDKFKDLLKVVK